jgi:hypothetical protein
MDGRRRVGYKNAVIRWSIIVMKTIAATLVAALMLWGTATSRAGLFNSTNNYSASTSPASVCLANLRGNGLYRDLAVADSGSNSVSVRLCLDDGTFGARNDYAVGDTPVSVRYGDLTGDRQDELITANSGSSNISVLVNLGVGANFRAATNFTVGATATPMPLDVATGDVNGDGKVDVVTANFGENTVSVLTNRGSAVLAGLTNYSVGTGPAAIALADMNNDGKLDIVTANKTAGTITILLNNGSGLFSSPQTISYASSGDPQPVAIWCRDLDGDGILDIVVANHNEDSVTTIIGSLPGGIWTLHSQNIFTVGAAPSGLVVRDLNHDGIMDFAVTDSGDDDLEVWLGDGTGDFSYDLTYAVGSTPSAIAASNFNGDEAADLVVANSGNDNVTVLLYSAPLAYNASVLANEDTTKSISLRGAVLSGTNLIFVTNSVPTNGIITLSGTNVVYTPDTNYFGADSFSYVTVNTNDSSTSAVALVTITVQSVNDAPSFVMATNHLYVWEDSALTNYSLFITSTNVGPANEAGQTISFTATPIGSTNFSTVTISKTGTLSFRPIPSATGTKTISVLARDTGGTTRGGSNASFAQTLTVDIMANPVKPLRGSYSGLFYDTNTFAASSAGFCTFTVSPLGVISGRVLSESGSDAFTGLFDHAGHAAPTVVRHSNTTLTLDLNLDLGGGSDRVLGTATDGSWTATLEGDRLTFNTLTNPAPQVGRYTMVMPGITNVPTEPAGDSYATLIVASNGIVSIVGRLSDAAVIGQTVGLSKDGLLPFYASPYKNRGVMMGWLQFTNLTATDLDGSLFWSRSAFTAAYYSAGFDVTVPVVGSIYTAPAANTRVVAITNALLTLHGGNLLTSPVTIGGMFSTNNTGSFTNGATVRLALPNTGVLDGNFLHPTLLLNKRFYGVALEKQNELRGFFAGGNQVGAFRIVNY